MNLSFTFLYCAVLFCGAVVSASNSVNQEKGPDFHKIKTRYELWRFTAGPSRTSLSIGDDYVCLLGFQNKFMASRGGRVYNDRDWCQSEERFVLEYAGPGTYALKRMLSNEYVACMENGEALLRKEGMGDREKFEVYLDKNDDRASFYNPIRKRYLKALPDGRMRCDSKSNMIKESVFLGWKTGKKEDWEVEEEGRLLRKYDNRRGTEPKLFNYRKLIGVKKVKRNSAGVRVSEPLEGGPGLKKLFMEFKSPTQTKWSKQGFLVWRPVTAETEQWEVPPRTTARLYQIIGYYGPLEIYSYDFMAYEVESKPQTAVSAT